MNKIFPFLILLFVFSCSDDEDIPKKPHGHSVSQGEVVAIETLFDGEKFDNPKHIELLKELKICSEFQKDTSNYLEPACSPQFFRIFPMCDNLPVENAFMVQIKSKVGGIKLRRLVTFVREKGELVKVNTFVANLIGTRKSPSHYYDLILRFNDNVDGDIIFYNTIFTWNGNKYEFKSAETIEGTDENGPWRQRIKQEFKDSVSRDIYNTLVKNEMIL